MGILIAEGTLAVAQFWPDGESDADTTKVVVKSFKYAESGDEADAKKTRVFEGARVRGRTTKDAIDKNGQITIRYQGIDAPELHYQAQAEIEKGDPDIEAKRAAFHEVNKRYRQHYGETAAVKLAEHVTGLAAGKAAVPCRVITYVDHPNDVFDTYGRFIGNVVIDDVDLNLWLVENGWAFPTFYSSMQNTEIEAFVAATKKGRKKGFWKDASGDLAHFDWSLVYEKGPFDAAADKGAVILPKMFRRLVSFSTNKKAKIITGGFKGYLSGKKSPDQCFETDEFLAHGATSSQVHFLHDYIDGTTFTAKPEDLVHQEGKSTLVDAEGEKVVGW